MYAIKWIIHLLYVRETKEGQSSLDFLFVMYFKSYEQSFLCFKLKFIWIKLILFNTGFIIKQITEIKFTIKKKKDENSFREGRSNNNKKKELKRK